MRTVRAGLVTLALLGIAGTTVELATERHWVGFLQLVPWFALATLTLALVLFALPVRPGVTAAIRLLAVAVLVTSMYGVFVHVSTNYDAGALDQRYAETWESEPVLTRWWLAVTKTVGPAPPLAPGLLGNTALLVLLATVGRGRRDGVNYGDDAPAGRAEV